MQDIIALSTKTHRRSTIEIKAKRDDMKRMLAMSQFRSLTSDRERAVELHLEHKATFDDIAEVLHLPRSTVRRWILEPWRHFAIGRPGYLHPEDHRSLFEEIIHQRARDHQPLTSALIVTEVFLNQILFLASYLLIWNRRWL